MFNQIVREKIAVAFFAASLTAGAILGIATVRSFNGSNTGALVAVNGSGGSGPQGSTTGGPTTTGGSTGSNTTTGGHTGGSTTPGGGLSSSQAQSGVTGGSITVGGIFDMTGPVDSSVERDTVRAYFSKINAQGGVNGRKLYLIDCDSKYDPVSTKQCATSMIRQKVLAIVGWTAPKAEDDVVTSLTGAGIPIIGGLGTPHEYTNSLAFPVSTPFTRYGDAEGQRAAQLGMKHPAIVTLNDVPWLQPVLQRLLDSLKAQGITPTDVETTSATHGDYTDVVQNLEHGSNNGTGCSGAGYDKQNPTICPDSLIAALDPFSYYRLFSAMDGAGWHPTNTCSGTHGCFLGVGLDKGNVVNPQDKSNLQTAYGDQIVDANSLVPFLSPYDHRNNATVSDYLSTVQRYFPSQVKNLDIYTQISWTAAMVFVEAAKRAGSNLTRQTLVQALSSISNFQTGWSTPLSFNTTDGENGGHDSNKCFTFTHHSSQKSPSGSWSTDNGSAWSCYSKQP